MLPMLRTQHFSPLRNLAPFSAARAVARITTCVGTQAPWVFFAFKDSPGLCI